MSTTQPDLGVPVRIFDHHHDPGLRTDPFTAFDRFRDEPVFWTPELDGFWVLTRHADIRAVLRDAQTFSSRQTSIPPAGWPRPLLPVELDPPTHGRFRALLVRCLAGPASTAISRAVERTGARLVADLAPVGRCDLVAEFAQPLRDALFAALFDVPESETEDCGRWAADLLQDTDPGRRGRAVREFGAYVGRAIAARTGAAHLGTGLLDALARADVDGRPMTGEEAVDMAFFVGMASLDTVSNAIGFSFAHLARHPELRRRLATDADCAANAADELLRLHSMVCVARTATRDTEIAGVRIRAGERILVSLALAGRDPYQYPDPATADFDRPNRAGHLAFGSGVHRCAGARIATQALTVVLREWHATIQDYAVVEGADLGTGGGALWSLDRLPLTWPVPPAPEQRPDRQQVHQQGGPS
jgi:cytochrome P450